MASPGAWADPEPTYHGSRHSGEGPLKSKRMLVLVGGDSLLPSCQLLPSSPGAHPIQGRQAGIPSKAV